MMMGPRHLSVLWMILLVAYEVKLSAAIDCSLSDNMGPSAVTYGTKWFCAVKGTVVVKAARELKVARQALGRAGWGQSQAIIPMIADLSESPTKLAKNWDGGDMWWWNWPDIHKMQAACRNACPMITTTRAPPTTTTAIDTTEAPPCELVYEKSRAPSGVMPAYTRQVNVPQGVVNQGQAKIEGFCNDKCLSTYRDNGLNRCRYVRAGCVEQDALGFSMLTTCKCDLWLAVRSGVFSDIGGTWYKCRN